MKWLTLFGGAGGTDCGLEDAGHHVSATIEYDENIAACFSSNFPQVQTIAADVRDYKQNLAQLSSDINALWASPVCKSHSEARLKTLEDREDASIGLAVIPYIKAIDPELVIIENVRGYRNHVSYQAILKTLIERGYYTSERVLDAADYGVPQHRRRLILQARKGKGPIWPDQAICRAGWYEAVKDMLPSLETSSLIDWQKERWLKEFDHQLPLMVNGHFQFDRGSGTRALSVVHRLDPMCTITSSHNNRDKRIVLQDKTVLKVSTEVLARLQTFPDSYKWPKNQRLAWEMVGNAVPCLLSQKLTEAYAYQSKSNVA